MINIVKKNTLFIIVIIFVGFSLVLVKEVFQKKLTGTFSTHVIPREYAGLNSFLSEKPDFYRTLWIPQVQRYGNFSTQKPTISGNEFFSTADPEKQISYLKNPGQLKRIQEFSIAYIIVPYDSEGEIFLEDRKYDEGKYQKTVRSLRSISNFKELKGFGKVKVFKVENSKPHFFSNKKDLIIDAKQVNPTNYIIQVKNGKKGDEIIFSESFDANWYAIKVEDDTSIKSTGRAISSNPYKKRLNSFALREDGNYTLEVFYLPQRWVGIGSIISFLTLGVIMTVLIFKLKK